MKCKSCGSWSWDLVWANAIQEEDTYGHLYQCSACKRIVLCGDILRDSGEIV